MFVKENVFSTAVSDLETLRYAMRSVAPTQLVIVGQLTSLQSGAHAFNSMHVVVQAMQADRRVRSATNEFSRRWVPLP